MSEKVEQPPETTPEDDAALDRIWDSIGKGRPLAPAPSDGAHEPPPAGKPAGE